MYHGTLQDERTPLEFYLEGNIIFRQGERVINAQRMYYDVPNHLGTILNADVLTPVRNYQGLLRLHADVVQQTGPDRYFAENGFLTSSRMGEPSYRLQSGGIYFEDIQRPVIDPLTGQPARDPDEGTNPWSIIKGWLRRPTTSSTWGPCRSFTGRRLAPI